MKSFRLIPFSLLALAGLHSAIAAESPTQAPTSLPPHIHMIGDSTMADKLMQPANPERGWGQLLPLYFRDPTMIVNYAANGRSTKSFIDEGRWEKARTALKPGDWLIIQFGHNDEKIEDPARGTDPATTFRDNLRRFVRETRAAGANPILATPIVRRKFDDAGNVADTHGDYPAALRAVAIEMNVPLLELHDLSRQLLASYGVESSKQLYLAIKPGEYASLANGRDDNTHLSAIGASRISELAIDEMRRLKLPLVEWLRK